MKKGIKTRYIIFKILKILKNRNINLDLIFSEKINNKKILKSDRKMIKNIVLNSMRYHFSLEEIIKKNTKKISFSSDTYFLLISALTQLLILNFKNFAVIDSTVELAKNKKINSSPKFINGFLRNIDRQNKTKVLINNHFIKLPIWFRKKVSSWDKKQKINFSETITQEPPIHIVFKDKNDLKQISINNIKTSDYSFALKEKLSIKEIPKYNEGIWWVQDYSTMAPLNLIKNIKNKIIADLCAAPGGKTFQLLAKGAKVHAYEKSADRVLIMKKNLHRLKFTSQCQINIKDVLEIDDSIKYDMVILDAPCSAIGTIRRNPEIFYRKFSPNFSKILNIQYKLLQKAKNLLKPKGELIYMVCSFLKNECEDQIYKFLKENKNFKKITFASTKNNSNSLHINEDGFYLTVPSRLSNKVLIDGFFAARLIKND